MIGILKYLQLATAGGAIALLWLMYPGALVAMAVTVGLCYVLLALGALVDFRPAIWLAFVFSLLTAVSSAYGVYRYVVNGFDFLRGRFPNQEAFHALPYVFALVALASLLVVLMHAASWRWMVRGR